MAQVAFTGMYPQWEAPADLRGLANNFLASSVIDAPGEMFAMCGSVWFAERTGTKSIRNIHVFTGAVTAGSGSTARMSLQNLHSTAAAPVRPDEVVDENWTTTTMPTANSIWSSGNLSANRTVSFGEALAVVVDFETFGSGTSIALRTVWGGNAINHGSNVVHKTGGSWASVLSRPNVVLEFSDGTFGTLIGSCVATSDFVDEAWNSGTALSDERGCVFTPEANFTSHGFWFSGYAGTDADIEAKLYEDGTAIETITKDFSHFYVAGSLRGGWGLWSQSRTFLSTKTYHITIRPTTTNNVGLLVITLSSASQRVCLNGTNFAYATKVDNGAFAAPTTTKVPMIYPLVSGIDDGAGSGGGGGGARSLNIGGGLQVAA